MFGIRIRDAMTTKPVTCSPNSKVLDAIFTMLEEGVGSILVVEAGKLVGIFTEKDVLSKIVAREVDPKKTFISDVMTREVITIQPDIDISFAVEMMISKGIRRLPVCDDRKLLGLVTEQDLLLIEPSVMDSLIHKKRIKEFHRKPVSVRNFQGKCEVCENFSYDLREVDGSFICPDCTEQM